MNIKWLSLITLVLVFSSCNGSSGSSTAAVEIDGKLKTIISDLNLNGDPSLGREIPIIYSPESQLGMKLFFSKDLGGDSDVACASCHHPTLGGGDDLALPLGVGALNSDLLGPGRKLSSHVGPNVPRNSPSTFNVSLWDESLFWDGRVESLGKTAKMNGGDGLGIRTPDSVFGQADPLASENLTSAQARFPVTSNAEMRGDKFEARKGNEDVRKALAERLSKKDAWRREFENVYGNDQITFQKIASAIAQYENSQTFVKSPWSEYVAGKLSAISPAAKRGALTFFTSRDKGGAGCVDCHSGDFFTDEKFHTIAVPQIGEGKGDGLYGDDDFGRFRETGDPLDMYAFRTPTLLNVEVTGPYGHSGAFKTLEEVVEHHLNVATSMAKFDANKLEAGINTENWEENTLNALITLNALREAGADTVYNVSYDELTILDLVEFLKTLSDPCVKDRQCLDPWIPEVSEEFDILRAEDPGERPL